MRVGLLGSGGSFQETAALAALAEKLGFDGFFLPEHHQQPYWPSSPLITLAAVAARTQRLRLGTAVTVMGLQFGYLLGGAVITESVFAWPGIGRLVVDAILARDFPVVQGAVLVIALGFVIVNLIVDVFYAYLDPRIRFE